MITLLSLKVSALLIGETTNQLNSEQIKSNGWFLRRGENWSTRGKICRSREEKQQTQPTYGVESGNRSGATLVEGEWEVGIQQRGS